MSFLQDHVSSNDVDLWPSVWKFELQSIQDAPFLELYLHIGHGCGRGRRYVHGHSMPQNSGIRKTPWGLPITGKASLPMYHSQNPICLSDNFCRCYIRWWIRYLAVCGCYFGVLTSSERGAAELAENWRWASCSQHVTYEKQNAVFVFVCVCLTALYNAYTWLYKVDAYDFVFVKNGEKAFKCHSGTRNSPRPSVA